MSYRPTAKGYFSGGGLMEIGIQQAGIDIIQSLEIDQAAADCMRANPQYFSHAVLQTDIKDITVHSQPKSDIIIGTYPCTKYSAIADIHGCRTGDDLFLHFFRHTALELPEMFIIENVPGMKKFPVVMEAMTQMPGYYTTVVCPVDAANWLPQRRKRLIIFGTRKPFFITPPNLMENRVRMRDIIESDPQVDMPEYVISRINGKYRDKPIIVDPDEPGAMAPTCVAHYAKDLGTRLVKDRRSRYGLRPFSIREYARLQGLPDDYILPDTREAYKIIGNGVPVDMGRWAGSVAKQYFN